MSDEKQETISILREYVDSLLVTVILALFGITFLVQAFKIPSQSMEETLLVGDHLLVNKFVFADTNGGGVPLLPYRDVRHGDIIVFKYPFPPYPHFVKRVIGLPGDRLRIVERRVYINGKPLKEPYKIHRSGGYSSSVGDDFPPPERSYYSRMEGSWREQLELLRQGDDLVIPPGKYFVMGDNRDNSQDSRYWGLVDRSNIIGRPLLIYWSFDPAERRALPGEDSRRGFFARMRWNRLLRFVR
ncbi:MAG: signal peptidase I [Candidatus Acidiferrales bacterium]